MEKSIKGETAVGIQAEAAGGHASQEIGQIFAIGAASHNLVRPRTEDRFWLCATAAAFDTRFRGNDSNGEAMGCGPSSPTLYAAGGITRFCMAG